MSWIRKMNWTLVTIVGITCVSIRLFVGGFAIVEGDSMNPTLQNHDLRLFTKFSSISRGDIVMFPALPHEETHVMDILGFHASVSYQAHTNVVKRVIAFGGDEVEVFGDVVWVNGKPLDEPYTTKGNTVDFPKTKVPVGKVFVMGDNRPHSMDSRYDSIGFVDRSELIGKVIN